MSKKPKRSNKTKSSKRTKAQAKPVTKTKAVATSKPVTPTVTRSKKARANISEGTRLYALAGHPTQAQFVNVYGWICAGGCTHTSRHR